MKQYKSVEVRFVNFYNVKPPYWKLSGDGSGWDSNDLVETVNVDLPFQFPAKISPAVGQNTAAGDANFYLKVPPNCGCL